MTIQERALPQKDPNSIALEHAILSFKQRNGQENGVDPATAEITRETGRRLNQSLNDPADPLGNELAKMIMLSVQRIIHDEDPKILEQITKTQEKIGQLFRAQEPQKEASPFAGLPSKDLQAIASARKEWPAIGASNQPPPEKGGPGKGGGMGRG